MDYIKQIAQELNKGVNKKRADWNNNSKPVQKGGYAEGDIFLGVPVPITRLIAKKYYLLISKKELDKLFKNFVHEYRFVACEILNFIYEKPRIDFSKKQAVLFLLKQLKNNRINNWDLVDDTAYSIIGDWTYTTKDNSLLYKLAVSKNLWEQRTAIVATMAHIRHNQLDETYKLSEILLSHSHDLIHKAVGWLLREAGIKDPKRLEKFIKKNYAKFPRTALRYAIERFPQAERKRILSNSY